MNHASDNLYKGFSPLPSAAIRGAAAIPTHVDAAKIRIVPITPLVGTPARTPSTGSGRGATSEEEDLGTDAEACG
jgi:hypothetical protein